MRNTTLILATMAAVFVATVCYMPEAEAQVRRRGTRVFKGGGPSLRSRSLGRSGLSRAPSVLRGRSSRGGSSPFGNLGKGRGSSPFGSLGRSRSSGPFGGSSPFGGSDRPGLRILGNLLNGADRYRDDGGYGGYPYGGGRYDSRSDYATAYRQVGMAHAAVNLIGIIAENSARNCQTQVVQQPTGHYETHEVVVQPGRYEQYQVWIPERYDPNTGRKLGGGHHETRTRWVPEVIERRQVYVSR